MRVLLRFESGLIDADEFLPFARVFPKAVVSDAVKPGGKFRFPAKTPDVLVGAEESLLRKVIGQGEIVARELPEQATDGRLMIPYQLGESVMVVIEKDARDKVGISKWHDMRLHLWGSVFFDDLLFSDDDLIFTDIEPPKDDVADADEEGNDAQAPGAAFPVVAGTEEDHQTQAD